MKLCIISSEKFHSSRSFMKGLGEISDTYRAGCTNRPLKFVLNETKLKLGTEVQVKLTYNRKYHTSSFWQ